MPVPAKRRASSQKYRRRAHAALKKIKLTPCPKCKKMTLPHYTCPACGYYKGRMIVDVMKKQDKKGRGARDAGREGSHK